MAFRTGRTIDLAAFAQGLGWHLIARLHLRRKINRRPIACHIRPVKGAPAAVIVARQIVRQVDHEARIAPRRPIANAPRFQHDHRQPRRLVMQSLRRRQPCKTRPDDQNITSLVAV